MNEETLKNYADIKIKIKQLEIESESLKMEIMESLSGETEVKIDRDYGNFTLFPKRKYSYSVGVEDMAKKIKELKEIEEADGTAQYTESYILSFKSKV